MKEKKLKLHGEVYDFTATELVLAIDYAVEQGYDQIRLSINSPGGSVLAGYSIISSILNSSIPVHAYIEGVAASIASIIAMSCDKIYMIDWGMMMFHNASYPDENELDDRQKKALQAFDASLLTIYQKRTGKSERKIKKWMDAETWFNSEEAMDEKLIDGIIKTKQKEKVAAMVMEVINKAKGPAAVFEIYNNLKNENDMELKNILNALGLETSDEATVVKTINDIQNKNTKLAAELEGKKTELENVKNQLTEKENALRQLQEAEIERMDKLATDLVNQAVTDRKITKDTTEKWLQFAKADYEGTKEILNGLSAKPKLETFTKDDPIEGDPKPVKLPSISAHMKEIDSKTAKK